MMMNRFSPYGNNSRYRGSGSGFSIFSNEGYGPQMPSYPMPPARTRETKKCATHGRKRTIKNLKEDDEGQWVCRAGSKCRQPTTTNTDSNSGETATCTLHGKTRTVANLGKNQNGDWVCLGSSLCKSGATGSSTWQHDNFGIYQGPQHGGWMSMPMGGGYGGGPFCSAHGKKRTMQNLIRNQRGEFTCKPNSRCKVAAGQEFFNGGGMKICSVHSKQRSASNMEQDEGGQWVCLEKFRCKVVPEGALSAGEEMCSIHNKSRTTPNLKQNEDGGWVCIDGSRCK